MNQEFLKILRLLDENDIPRITIPEINWKGIVIDKFMGALMLSSVFGYSEVNPNAYKPKIFDKEKVMKAYEFTKRCNENDIAYLGISGKRAEEAKEHAKKTLGNNVVIDAIYREIKLESQFFLPVKKRALHLEQMKSLSTLGVTVISYRPNATVVYSDGFKIENSREGVMPFIDYVNACGYFYEEYLLGELIYFLSLVDSSIKDILFNNINSVFIQSLTSLFEDMGFKRHYLQYDPNERNNFNDLIGILRQIDFQKIKNYKFSFVRDYLYA